MIEFLRLAFATFVVLLPGALVARGLGQRSVSAALAWAMGAIFLGLLLVGVRLRARLFPAARRQTYVDAARFLASGSAAALLE